MSRIKKNDTVIVLAGRDRGKTGKVLKVFPSQDRAVVETINKMKKSQRPTQQNQKGGFLEIEAPIHLSNLMVVDKKSGKGTRLGAKTLKDGSKTRVAKKSGEVV